MVGITNKLKQISSEDIEARMKEGGNGFEEVV